MRKKRSATERQRKKRNRNAYRIASMLSIASFGIVQTIPSSYSAFSDVAKVENGFVSASFVFPSTIEDIVNEVTKQKEIVDEAKKQAAIILKQCTSTPDSKSAKECATEIEKLLESASKEANMGLEKAAEIDPYVTRAKKEAKKDKSMKAILTLVQEGEKQVQVLRQNINTGIREMEKMADDADEYVEAKILEEKIAEEALRKQMELEKQLAEEALRKQMELEKQLAEEEAKKQAELEKQLAEEEAKKQAELEKQLAEEEAKKQAELEKQLAEEKAKKQAELEKQLAEEEMKKQAELEKQLAEEEAKKKLEEEKNKTETGSETSKGDQS
ncbi:hypothetical protein CUU64_14330, partial [Bacillus sp. V5-8f]